MKPILEYRKIIIAMVFYMLCSFNAFPTMAAQGNMTVGDKAKPAVICRTKEQVILNENFGGASKLKVGVQAKPEPGQTTSDGSQPQTLPDSPELRPRLTEVLLLDIEADGSGMARLDFANVPPDLTALYISRSPDGKSWTKEKNKKKLPSSQGGQDTVEYENFLKEPGNTLDTSIVNDGYMVYNFQSANRSFYIKVRLEWPGGTWESGKTKVAIPEYTGQGLTFSNGGESYGGDSGSYGTTGKSSYGGYSGNDEAIQDTQEEKDTSRGPISRGGEGLSWKDFLPKAGNSPQGSTKKPENTSPSTASPPPHEENGLNPPENAENPENPGRDSHTQSAGGPNTDTFKGTSPSLDPHTSQPQGENPTESPMPVPEDSPGPGTHIKSWLAAAIIPAILIGAAAAVVFRHKKK